jgi:hypothetical protein
MAGLGKTLGSLWIPQSIPAWVGSIRRDWCLEMGVVSEVSSSANYGQGLRFFKGSSNLK